jgi:hypothetical protein
MIKEVLSILKQVYASMGPHSDYGVLDLRLHRLCEGQMHLVDACKRAIAPHVSNLAPRHWVRAAVDRLEKP